MNYRNLMHLFIVLYLVPWINPSVHPPTSSQKLLIHFATPPYSCHLLHNVNTFIVFRDLRDFKRGR